MVHRETRFAMHYALHFANFQPGEILSCCFYVIFTMVQRLRSLLRHTISKD